MEIKLIFADKIELKLELNKKNEYKINCIINDKYYHSFDQKSKMVKLLNSFTLQEIEKRYINAPFIFAKTDSFREWELVDYRDNLYKGFIQTENNMQKFVEHIGFSKNNQHQRREINRVADLFAKHRTNKQGFDFSGDPHKVDFHINGVNEGGQFAAQQRFSWSPFESTISSQVEVVRLVCSNGMVAMSPLLRNQIPIVNNIAEHLNIAKMQISDNLSLLLQERLEQLVRSTATVSQALFVNKHANLRVKEDVNKPHQQRLYSISYVSNPYLHIPKDTYNQQVFTDSNLANIAPSHLTKFDVWNMLTEMDTYTVETNESTSFVLQKMINTLMFDQTDALNSSTIAKRNIVQVADHNRAFFGDIQSL